MTNNNDIPEQKFKVWDKVYHFSNPIAFQIQVIRFNRSFDRKFYYEGENCYFDQDEIFATKQELIEAFTKYVMEELE
jgi:hypothetical protein